MVVYFICGRLSTTFSYSGWGILRGNIVRASIAYVKNLQSDLKAIKVKPVVVRPSKKKRKVSSQVGPTEIPQITLESSSKTTDDENEDEENKDEQKRELLLENCQIFLKNFECLLHQKPPIPPIILALKLPFDIDELSYMDSAFISKCNPNSVICLPFLGLQGLFSLTDKADNEGAYSPGESLDICTLLEKVKPFCKSEDFKNFPDEWYDEVYEIFKESYTTRQYVHIS